MSLSKEKFTTRLRKAMAQANEGSARELDAEHDQIELHFMGTHDLNLESALDRVFIDDEQFFKVIDVSVHPKRDGWFFMRVSGHQPASIEQVRDKDGLGPFNVMFPA